MDEEKVREISTLVVKQVLPEHMRGNQNVVGWVEMIRQAVRLTLEQQEEQQMLDRAFRNVVEAAERERLWKEIEPRVQVVVQDGMAVPILLFWDVRKILTGREKWDRDEDN